MPSIPAVATAGLRTHTIGTVFDADLDIGDSAFQDAGIPMAFLAPGGGMGELGLILRANQAMADFCGGDLASLAGRPFLELLHPDDRDTTTGQIEALCSDAVSSCSYETRFRHGKGQHIWGLVTVTRANHVRAGSDGPPLIVQVQDISERKHVVGQLQAVVDQDPLTSLYNRRRFGIDVERQLAWSRRYGGGGAVLMLDLDHFKTINDQYGHAAGDALLLAVAGAIGTASRETDRVARLGGDEFAVLLPETPLEEAAGHGHKLLEAIRAIALRETAPGLKAAASCGVAAFAGGDGQCADDLLINADLALYQAKEAGRGRVQVFSAASGLHEKVQARLLWSERIRTALDHDGFVLQARPVVDLRSGLPRSHELLIRLRGAEGELIHPSVFLYTAERFGLALEIDLWVVRRAIQLLEAMTAEPMMALAVNISAGTLQSDRYIEALQGYFADHNVAPQRLIVELSEAVALANLERAHHLGRELRLLGCRLALDDFGEAVGSLHHLQHLPVDQLKLAGAYTRGLCGGHPSTDHLFVEALVKLTDGLSIQLVAAGISDAATRSVLMRLGVELGQGPLFGMNDDMGRLAQTGEQEGGIGPRPTTNGSHPVDLSRL